MKVADTMDLELLGRIPYDASMVLDIGPGIGALATELKRRNPASRIIGVRAAAHADEAGFDAIYPADFAADPAPFRDEIGAGAIDCIIYSDLMACTDDPVGLLRAHLPFLSTSGLVILGIINADNWQFLESSLRGVASFEDGPRSQTHRTQWLTVPMLRRVLQSLSLRPLDMTTQDGRDAAPCEAFVDAIGPSLSRLGIDSAAFAGRVAPAKAILRARRDADAEPLTVVSTMLSPIGGVSEVRVVAPMDALRADPRIAAAIVASSDDFGLNTDGPRIFIFHRPLLAGPPGLDRIRTLIERGWVVVCEFDDHPDYIPVLQRPDVHNFTAVHAIQTSTQPLAEFFRATNPETVVFENTVARLPDIRSHGDSNEISILFAGLNRDHDWPPYMDAINAIAARHDGRIHFEVINDRAFFDAIKPRKKSFTPLCDYETYQYILSTCDVSFMPLSDTPFNRCKSDLKYIEAASYGIAALASDVVYDSVIDDGSSGLVFRSVKELAAKLDMLATNPSIARQIGRKARDYVARERMLAYQVAERVDWYASLWARRDELNRRLLERVPELLR